MYTLRRETVISLPACLTCYYVVATDTEVVHGQTVHVDTKLAQIACLEKKGRFISYKFYYNSTRESFKVYGEARRARRGGNFS